MIPVQHSLDVLRAVATNHQLDVSIEVLDGAGHSVIHQPELFPTILDWPPPRGARVGFVTA